jgi:hypothetical protein
MCLICHWWLVHCLASYAAKGDILISNSSSESASPACGGNELLTRDTPFLVMEDLRSLGSPFHYLLNHPGVLQPRLPLDAFTATHPIPLYQLNVKPTSSITVWGVPVRCRYHPPSKGKGFGFWHVIQEGPAEQDRIPDLRRCERIRWISWMIRQVGKDPRITHWKEERGRQKDVLLWMEEMDYLVVLSRRRSYLLLKTAYCTDKPHKRETLIRSRAAYWKAQQG